MLMTTEQMSLYLKMCPASLGTMLDNYQFNKFRKAIHPIRYEVDNEFLDLLKIFLSRRNRWDSVEGLERLREYSKTKTKSEDIEAIERLRDENRRLIATLKREREAKWKILNKLKGNTKQN